MGQVGSLFATAKRPLTPLLLAKLAIESFIKFFGRIQTHQQNVVELRLALRNRYVEVVVHEI